MSKAALEIAKNETPKDRKALAEKANKWTDLSSANCSEDNPQEKSWVEDGSGKQREKVTLRREKGGPTWEKAVILSSKMCETTKKKSWVDKALRKSSKKKCFEENGAL